MLRIYMIFCVLLFGALSYEYAVLNEVIAQPSLLQVLQGKKIVSKDLNLSPDPGKPISYALGWLGFSIMCLTNVYVLRKRLPFLKNFGGLQPMLDFHILCGVLGPILILFHTNFKVGGLVAISFWCMVISFTSGVVGRYAYMQLLQTKTSLANRVRKMDQGLKTLSEKHKVIAPENLQAVQKAIYQYYGLQDPNAVYAELNAISIPRAFFLSLAAEFGHFMPSSSLTKLSVPRKLKPHFQQYAKVVRQISFLEPFRRFMGYWHTFHLPFAIFMYVIAIIHIITALIFKVG